jgi:hypothetical protein
MRQRNKKKVFQYTRTITLFRKERSTMRAWEGGYDLVLDWVVHFHAKHPCHPQRLVRAEDGRVKVFVTF